MFKASTSEPTEEYLRQLLESSEKVSDELLRIGFDRRVRVLAEIGRLWRSKLSSSELEGVAEELAKSTGYSIRNIELDLALISEVLSEESLRDLFDYGLVGGYRSIDSPVEISEGELVWNKPVGSVFIIASGNSVVPPILAASASLLAGNLTILRPSQSNFTAIEKVFSLLTEISSAGVYDAEVLNRAIHVLYMSHESPALKYVLEEAPISAVNYWGGEPGRSRVLSTTMKNPHRPRVLINGPYTGIALVDEESADSDAARKLARDVVLYDQQLCSSPTLAIFIGSRETLVDFLKKLSKALDDIGDRFPVELTEGSFYKLHTFRKSLELGRVDVVYSRSASNPWTIIVRKLDELNRVPLAWSTYSRRVLEIVNIEKPADLDRVLEIQIKRLRKLGVDGVQTVSCAVSRDVFKEVVEILTKFNIHRIVPLGESFLRTPAEPYDGEFIPKYFTRAIYLRIVETLSNLRQRGVHLP
ncbi:MAG: aldehyde dehydrogenase family protein [Sulfolobales archaeon]|nr:aldehyde dehydrogenase family protein [Sulfolobales archaeon]MDW8082821.1 aldehyde dehydrogenase family protein [Sulfolobales archaeon]